MLMLYKMLDINKNKKVYEKINRTKQLQQAEKQFSKEAVVGWLTIYDADIDVPIVTNKKNKELTLYDIGSLDYGWVINDNNKYTNKIGITGHNIMNLSSIPIRNDKSLTKFENLMSYVYEDFAREHEYLQYTVDGKTHYYKIFSVFFSNADRYFGTKELTNNQMKHVINDYKKASIYDYDVDLDKTDNIICLATCSRFFGAQTYEKTFVVVGRELRNNEKKMVEYKMETNDNYKRIEKTMKGSEENE